MSLLDLVDYLARKYQAELVSRCDNTVTLKVNKSQLVHVNGEHAVRSHFTHSHGNKLTISKVSLV